MEIADVEEVYQHQYKDIAIIKLNRKIKFSSKDIYILELNAHT